LAEPSPRICAAIVSDDPAALQQAGELADLIELRLDLIGPGWRELAGRLKRPWIACNRRAAEGGKWRGGEAERVGEIRAAVGMGAAVADIELATPGLADIIKEIKGKALCLLSYHNIKETPPLDELRDIIKRQLAAGADICKVITTAKSPTDNITVLRLIRDFPEAKVVAFAMGELGQVSRVLAPLAGGYFTYASLGEGRESAPGQLTIAGMREIYRIIGHEA
jgi:3-dehydroquinate dehydratase-1